MPLEIARPPRSLAAGLTTGIAALAFGWLGHPIFALACTLFAVSSWATWIHSSYVARSRLGVPPPWLSGLEKARAYLANEEFEPAKGR